MNTLNQIFAINYIRKNTHIASILVNGVHFPCSIGRAGISHFKREGDNASPAGTWRLNQVMYRSDRIRRPLTILPTTIIQPDMGWCDDPISQHYNSLVKLPCPARHEKLWREDNLYDLIVILDYNRAPVVKGKGSAIFMHIRRSDGSATEGCIALKHSHLLHLLKCCRRDSVVCVTRS